MIDTYIDSTAKVSILDILGAPSWVPRPSRAMIGSDIRRIKSIADRAIASHKANKHGEAADLLDLLEAGEDPDTKRRMTRQELRDNLLAFIVAGHETTALTLSWALYLLSHDKDAQNRARDEINAATVRDSAEHLSIAKDRARPPAWCHLLRSICLRQLH